jgi:hemolysin III
LKNSKTIIPPNEIANALTHGIGAVLSIAALVLLVVAAARYGSARHIVSFSIYGAMLVILYMCSTLYHSFQAQKVKRVFRILDHSAVFLLIAGTYTPFALVTLQGALGWAIFGVIWGMALTGIVFKAFFIEQLAIVSTIFYIIMGWLIVGIMKPLAANMASGGLTFLIAGGLLYTIGVFFYARTKNLFNHSVWHLFVLGGSICHFFSIYFYVLPR